MFDNMNTAMPQLYLVRHGETAWSISGQHTGRTDIDLTKNGEDHAKQLDQRLRGIKFEAVYSSSLIRARRTCELAGFGSVMQIEPDLMEWNYGEYEGLTKAEIRQKCPNWIVFRDGCLGGESVLAIKERVDRLILSLRKNNIGNTLLFSHGHFLRVFAARWLNLSVGDGGLFDLSPTSVSILGYEHNLNQPVIKLWNQIT